MTAPITKIKIFVASPGDVKTERQQLSEVVKELNSTICREKNLILELVRWETDCYPAMGRPQGEINKQIGAYDIFVGIMWKRFGTPTGVAESGTEEEFRFAYTTWEESKTPHILFYFSNAPFMPKTREEVEQIGKVLEFRTELSKKGLVWEYSDGNDFANVVRPHLTRVIGEMFNQKLKGSKNLLHQYWDNLDPYLQDAFALAYNQSRREGTHIIQTRTLFAAMMKLKPEPLEDLFKMLPKESLPHPINENSTEKQYILREEPNFSGCVAESLENIGQRASPVRKLSAKDVFVDIAKHGSGKSVRRLRTNGVSAKDIDEIVNQLGWQVIERDKR